jgi:hypothetical protein
MDWKLAGLKKLVHAEGPEVTRAALARGAAETVWIPTATLPRFGKARNDEQIEGSWTVDGYQFTTRYTLDSYGMISSVVFDRWGDPERSGSFGVHPLRRRVLGLQDLPRIDRAQPRQNGLVLRTRTVGRRRILSLPDHRRHPVWSGTSAVTTSTPSRRRASSSALSAFESVISTSMSSRPIVCHIVSLPIFV